MKSAVVIYNPNSGHSLKTENLPKYKKIIEDKGYSVTFIPTQYSGHAKEIVSHINNVDLVISMGGDGTFNEIMNGNLQRKNRLILAHIPVGTTNDIGAMFGYGKDIAKNLKMCLDGEIKGIDICMINNTRPFVYVAGFGKFLQIPYETPRQLKKKYGHGAYLMEGFKDLIKGTKNYEIEFEIDGVKRKGIYSFVLISSATRIAGMSNFYKNVYLNDDTFEVLMCTYTRRLDIIRALGMLIRKDAEHIAGFEIYRTNHLKIKFDKYPKKAWCVDGEKLEIRTLKYDIHNEKDVQILMPKKNIDKLFIKENEKVEN